uniref:Uncharacterized protein n=1 Tax=Anguilla anguilla TaxID=7936 RepID=A0A0E9WSP1_ANGAN
MFSITTFHSELIVLFIFVFIAGRLFPKAVCRSANVSLANSLVRQLPSCNIGREPRVIVSILAFDKIKLVGQLAEIEVLSKNSGASRGVYHV